MKQKRPILSAQSQTTRNQQSPVRGDVIAGISVAAIAIPQSLAYAEIAGMPVHLGLYAAALPSVFAAFFASSRYLQTGPVAMTGLLTFGAISGLATPGSTDFVQLGILLALMVGFFRVALGLMKAGVLAYLMSQPVLLGFTSGAAILIVASQLEIALGVPGLSGPLPGRAALAMSSPHDWNVAAIGVCLLTFVIVSGGQRLHRLFPGVLAAVVLGVVANRWLELPVQTLGHIPGGMPGISLDVPWHAAGVLFVPAVVIALVGFAEPAAIAQTMATRDRQRWDPDREFISQGIANIVSGLCGAFPVGGSFSRSYVAKLAGGRTRFTGLIAGLIVFLSLPFAQYLSTLPRAVLAAIVIAAIVKLIRVDLLLRLVRKSWGQSIVGWGTFLSTLWLAPRLDHAVIVGIALATAIHLRREALIRVETVVKGGTIELVPWGVLYFGSAPRLGQTLADQMAASENIESVVVNLTHLGRIDYTGVIALQTFLTECREAELNVRLTNIPDHARGTMQRCLGDELASYESGADG